MRKTLVLTLILASAIANSQTYSGTLGNVVPFSACIKVDWFGKFKGYYEIVPTIRVPIQGEIRGSRFKVYGWFETSVKWTKQSVLGDGVWLYRK